MFGVVSPAVAYRTASDLPEFEGTAVVHWEEESLVFRLGENIPPGIETSTVEDTLIEALRAWNAIECGGLDLRYQGLTPLPGATGDGTNTIEWLSSGWTELGYSSTAPGITDVQYEKGEDGLWRIVEADIYLNADDFDWIHSGDGSVEERDILSVLIHELGHAIGLMHPCEPDGVQGAPDCADDEAFAETTMYPIYSSGQAVLSSDDVEGACYLYPLLPCEETGCASNEICTTDGCVSKCADEVCGTNEQCGPLGCMTVEEIDAYEQGRDTTTRSCSHDIECAPNERCIDQKCLFPESSEDEAPTTQSTEELLVGGDPCARDRQCESRVCVDSYCARSCRSVEACLPGQLCIFYGGGSGVCEGDGKPSGEICEDASECLGGQCVEGATSEPICTRLCGGSQPACPSSWGCAEAEGRPVCTPPYVDAWKSCTVSSGFRTERKPSLAMSYVAVLLVIAVAFRSRNRRKRIDSLSDIPPKCLGLRRGLPETQAQLGAGDRPETRSIETQERVGGSKSGRRRSCREARCQQRNGS